MAVEPAQLPQLVSLERFLGLPIVDCALAKSAKTYFRLKNSNQLLYWALTTAETSLNNASKQAVPLATPIAKKLESPINFIDHTICLGLDKIEEKIPLVKENPEQIMHNAYRYAAQTVAPAVSGISYVNDIVVGQATNMRDVSWKKINEILNTRYGSAVAKGVDNTAVIIDKLVDDYFPAFEAEENEEKSTEIVQFEEDKLIHTLQTVGHLSTKIAKRIYPNIKYALCVIRNDYLILYIDRLLEFLHLSRALNMVNKKTQTQTDNEAEERNREKNN